MLPRLAHRLPWSGVVVTRLTCQEKETLSPFRWISRTARHAGHSTWKTELASIWRASSSIFPEKAQPIDVRGGKALVSPNGIASRTTLAHACFGGFGSHLWQRL